MSAGWDLRTRILRIPYRDPFRIARDSHGAGGDDDDGHRRAPLDRSCPGLVGLGEGYPDAYYGETLGDDAGGHGPMLLEAVEPATSTRRAPTAAGASLAAIGAAFDGAIRGHGAAKCALDIALHDLAGKATGVPVHRLLGPLRRDPADRLHPRASTSRRSSPSAPAGRRASRPSRSRSAGPPTSPRSRPCGRSTTARSASTPTPAGRRTTAASLAARSSCDLGVELIEQPFPPRRYDWLAGPPGGARRCRSSPTRAPS